MDSGIVDSGKWNVMFVNVWASECFKAGVHMKFFPKDKIFLLTNLYR